MTQPTSQTARLGIFAGTFDPIHLGHSSFMEQAIASHGLDEVLILVEKNPRFKICLASYEHRLAMVKLAIAADPKLSVYETNCDDFPISNCLPIIRKENPNIQLFLLLGDDVAEHIQTWPDAKRLLRGVELIIGHRQPDAPSSVKIRSSIKTNTQPVALDPAVHRYVTHYNLYE